MAEKAISLRQRALGFLARREYSRLELKRKLAPHAENEEEVENLLEDFQKRGWLSEDRYTEQLIHARRAKYGTQRIVQELREKGVGEEAISAALPELKDSELETAKAVWVKKFGQPPVDAKDKARQVRFLASRGFRMDVIFRVLGGGDED
ncbi:MAG: recombination regulator RecX [Sulfuricellaceae bacterium]|jgi:regulatory protein